AGVDTARGRRSPPRRVVAAGVDPLGDLVGVEAEEVTPLDVGDALLVDETADVADVDAEELGDLGDGDEAPRRRRLRTGGCGHGCLLCGLDLATNATRRP